MHDVQVESAVRRRIVDKIWVGRELRSAPTYLLHDTSRAEKMSDLLDEPYPII